MKPKDISVLVVNQQPVIKDVLVGDLGTEGIMNVDYAANRKEACELIKRNKHLIAIVDTHLEGMYDTELSLDVRRTIRKESPETKIILISDDEDACINLVGTDIPDAFFRKPFKADEITEKVKSYFPN